MRKCGVFATGRMPRSGNLPVFNLLRGQKSGLSPPQGDSLHQFRSNFAGPTGTWVRLILQNFTSIGAARWKCGPKNIKNVHFLVNSRSVGATPLTDFEIFLAVFIPLHILHSYFKFHVNRFTSYGVIAEKPRVGILSQIFPRMLIYTLDQKMNDTF